MGMFSKLARRFHRAPTFAVAQWIGMSMGEIADGVDGDDPKAYQVNCWVYACVDAIAQATASAPLVIERRRGKKWEVVEDTPLGALLDYVNTEDDQYRLIEQTSAWVALYGNSHWHLLRASEAAKPTAIQVLQSQLVEPVPGRGKRSATVSGYKYNTASGERPVWPDTDVVHFRRFNPFSSAVGQSPIRVLEQTINTYLAVESYNKAFFKGGGMPAAILSTEHDMTKDDAVRYRAFWDEWAAQGQLRQRPLFLGKGLRLDVPGKSPDTATVTELPRSLRETICAVMQVPPAIVGLFEHADYANANMQERLFYTRTVTQYWRRIESALNEQLAPQFGPDLRTRFDTSKISALKADFVASASAVRLLTGGQAVMDVNEARVYVLGLPEKTPEELAAMQPAQALPVPMETMPAEERRAVDVVRVKALRRLDGAQRKSLWEKFNAGRDSETKRIKRVVAEWYEPVTAEVLANIDAAGKARHISRVKAPNIDVLMFAQSGATQALRESIGPVLRSILAATGQASIAQIGADLRFDVQSPRALDLLSSRTQEMKTVVATAQDSVRASLAEGIANGETVDQLKARVLQWSATGKDSHAETVARTESGIVMNTAAVEGYRQGGANGKEWLSIVDDRSRPEHADMDGTVVGIEENFTLNGVDCDGPGDPSLDVGELANCRCTVAPVVGE